MTGIKLSLNLVSLTGGFGAALLADLIFYVFAWWLWPLARA